MTWWHLHRWTRWRNFTYVDMFRKMYGGLTIWCEVREPRQEKVCRRCGKSKQRKV